MKERLVRWLDTLTAKYVAVFVLLVAVPSIGISVYLLDSSYNDNKAALIRLQQERADAVAAKIEERLQTIVGRLRSMHFEGQDLFLLNALEHVDFWGGSTLFYLNSNGVGGGVFGAVDKSADPAFKKAKRDGVYFSGVSGQGPEAGYQLMVIMVRETAGP